MRDGALLDLAVRNVCRVGYAPDWLHYLLGRWNMLTDDVWTGRFPPDDVVAIRTEYRRLRTQHYLDKAVKNVAARQGPFMASRNNLEWLAMMTRAGRWRIVRDEFQRLWREAA